MTIGVLAAALSAGVPWILAPLLAGLSWMLASTHRRTLIRRLRALRFQASQIVKSVVIGLGAGLIAMPIAQSQIVVSPVQLPWTQPPPVFLAAAVVVLAAANAVGEELLWRGVLTMESSELPSIGTYLLQFTSFGLAHLGGVPGGPLGAMLTGGFGCAMLSLTGRWGLPAAIIAHFIADLLIFAIVAPHLLFTGWYSSPG